VSGGKPTLRDVEEETALLQARSFIEKARGKRKMLTIREWIAARMKAAAQGGDRS